MKILKWAKKILKWYFRLSPVAEAFVFKQMKAIKINKSTGFANIIARLFEDGSFSRPLTVIINISLMMRLCLN
jgi:hypothetical protein